MCTVLEIKIYIYWSESNRIYFHIFLNKTYLERQKCYGPDKKILFKKQRPLRYVAYRLMVMHPHTKYIWPIWKDKKSYGPDKLHWEEAEGEAEEAEAEEKIRLKQYVYLMSYICLQILLVCT
jgi:hypothetical protein